MKPRTFGWRSDRAMARGEPRRLPQDVNSPAVEMLSSVARNGNLYFSSNRPGGQGDFDLYVARWTGSGYAPAENLGPAVNTNAVPSPPLHRSGRKLPAVRCPAQRGTGPKRHLHLRPSSRRKLVESRNAAISRPQYRVRDMRPSVSEDGSILWFCSDRLGSQDIFWVDWRRVR